MIPERGRELADHGRELPEHGRELPEPGRAIPEHARELPEPRRAWKYRRPSGDTQTWSGATRTYSVLAEIFWVRARFGLHYWATVRVRPSNGASGPSNDASGPLNGASGPSNGASGPSCGDRRNARPSGPPYYIYLPSQAKTTEPLRKAATHSASMELLKVLGVVNSEGQQISGAPHTETSNGLMSPPSSDVQTSIPKAIIPAPRMESASGLMSLSSSDRQTLISQTIIPAPQMESASDLTSLSSSDRQTSTPQTIVRASQTETSSGLASLTSSAQETLIPQTIFPYQNSGGLGTSGGVSYPPMLGGPQPSQNQTGSYTVLPQMSAGYVSVLTTGHVLPGMGPISPHAEHGGWYGDDIPLLLESGK